MNKKITVAQFSDWLERHDAVMMDDQMVSFSAFEKDVEEAVYILDMDDDFPEQLLEIDENNSSIEMQGTQVVVCIAEDGHCDPVEWIFKPLKMIMEGDVIETGKVHVIKLDRETETIEDMTTYTDTPHGNDCAEEQFKHYCSDCISNWDEYPLADVEACIENGYEQNGKWKIMIVHF